MQLGLLRPGVTKNEKQEAPPYRWRGFSVVLVEPDRVLLMPEDTLDHWGDDYLELVELA